MRYVRSSESRGDGGSWEREEAGRRIAVIAARAGQVLVGRFFRAGRSEP